MGVLEWVALAGVWAMALAFGTAAIFRGQVPTRLRGHVMSPRLWAAGNIIMALGFTVLTTSPLWPDNTPTVLGIVGLLTMLCGFGFTVLACHPQGELTGTE